MGKIINIGNIGQMQKLTVIINCPVHEVFEYTLNPENTPRWIDSIVKEEVNERPIKMGTIYKNTDLFGFTNEYKVISLKKDTHFQLKQKGKHYYVRYHYKPIGKNKMELTYIEWVIKGNLENPFTQKTLEKLKSVMEL